MSESANAIKQVKKRLIASYSFLIPAKKYTADFDVTARNPLPAFLEISIQLLDTLNRISPYELQSFLGINDNEREELLQQIISTNLAFLNENGDIEVTSGLNELKQSDGTIQLEGIERYTASFYIDLASEHIQPRASNPSLAGFYELVSEETLYNEFSAESIFQEDFNRFKLCTTIENIKKSKTRLYRINSCFYEKLVSFPVSVDIHSEWQSDGHLKISSSLSGFSGDNLDLVVNSGILRYINTIFNNQTTQNDSLSVQDFCLRVQDNVLLNFEGAGGTFDIEKYLRERDKRRTGYGSPKTTGIIGSIYLPQNKGGFINWLSRTPSIQPILWLPSSASYWGASAYSRAFYEQVAELLTKKQSSLSLVFPKASSKQEAHECRQRYGGIADNLLSFQNAPPLDEMEILIVPGSPCWAMVQYHARIAPAYGLRDARIPIGYTTYDPERVKMLWELMLRRTNFQDVKDVEQMTAGQVPDKILECLSSSHHWDEHSSLINSSSGEEDAVE
ncbi:hypothetical protein LJC59_00810 [Desulfovibrio sp. OttesenSCG-928-A18]|nr:hypothetical protein [Desulfovibrio sp. OttesenSCG-928-A18]